MTETPKFVPKDVEEGGWTPDLIALFMAWLDMIMEKQENKDIIDVVNGKKEPPNRFSGF